MVLLISFMNRGVVNQFHDLIGLGFKFSSDFVELSWRGFPVSSSHGSSFVIHCTYSCHHACGLNVRSSVLGGPWVRVMEF